VTTNTKILGLNYIPSTGNSMNITAHYLALSVADDLLLLGPTKTNKAH